MEEIAAGGFLSLSSLNGYPNNTALIILREKDVVYEWAIAALPGKDNEATLKEHLRKVYPCATMIGWAIK